MKRKILNSNLININEDMFFLLIDWYQDNFIYSILYTPIEKGDIILLKLKTSE